MTSDRLRPLLLLDVDGPLNSTTSEPESLSHAAYRADTFAGVPVLVGTDHPQLLARLAERLDLVWATTWEDAANQWWSPALGPPTLPVCPMGLGALEKDVQDGVFWKTVDIANFVGTREFVWVDDDITPADADWLGRSCSQRFWLFRVDPATGLTLWDTDIICSLVDGGVCRRRSGQQDHQREVSRIRISIRRTYGLPPPVYSRLM